jgi:hypothetical protein
LNALRRSDSKHSIRCKAPVKTEKANAGKTAGRAEEGAGGMHDLSRRRPIRGEQLASPQCSDRDEDRWPLAEGQAAWLMRRASRHDRAAGANVPTGSGCRKGMDRQAVIE